MTIDNTEQRQAWNGESGLRWVADADRRDRVLKPVADAVAKHALAQPGERVLDIGCGCGATTIAAAHAVQPHGSVHGIDLSVPMLDVARRRCTDAGLTNVELVEADAQSHHLPQDLDLAVSRFGTMFFNDPPTAFTNIASALRPGGRLCLATWRPLLANDWLTIPGAVLLDYGTMPDTGDAGPGMFAQSDPEVVQSVLTAAGFQDIDLAPVDVRFRLGADPAEAVDYLTGSGAGRAVLDTVAPDNRPRALEAVKAALAGHTTPAGVELGAAIWIITARKPF